ncbi:MAG: RNA polymerase sigma factor [Acidobacteriota bacterium]|nr:RNA polymerase sigma factor [Acidobacteriota bacterium]
MTEARLKAAYSQYRDPLFRFGYRLTGSVEAAEDAVHDSFIGLFNGGFDESRASLKTYLFAAVRNQVRKRLRDYSREDQDAEVEEIAATTPLDIVISEETASAVQNAVAALPVAQREVLVLFEYEELSLEEIARIAEIDAGAVKSRLFRARAALRKLLCASLARPAVKEPSR